MMNSAFDGKDIETARGSTKSLSSSENTDQSKENKKENLNDGIKKTSNTSDRKSKSLSKGSSRKDADGTLTDEVFEGKTPESSQGSKRSLSSTNPNENQGEKLNRSVTEKNLKHEKRKSKSSTKGLKQTDNLDGSLMKEEYIEKDLEFYPGPTKSCRNAVDDDEDKENREELINVGVKEKRSKQDEREKRKSKSSSKDLKQKDILDGKSLNDTSSGKGIQSRTMDIQEKKSKDGETMGSKSKQDVDLNSEHEVNHFIANQNEKRKSRTKSIGSKKDDYRTKPFKEEPEDSDFLTIHNERKRTQLTVQEGEAKEVAGTAMKEVLKQKKLETPSRSKKGLEEEKKVNQDHDKINGNREKSNKKEKRKSKIKSMDLKQIDFDGGESIKGELDDSVFLPAPMEGKREKRPRSEDTDGTPGSKTFKKEPEDQDFVIIPKDVKRKRSMAEGAEEALSERKIKKIKTEINDQELSTKEEKSEQEIQLKKKKKKKKEEKEVEIKPKKEKEGNQETKKKKTKEERELIADIKAKKKEEEEKQQWRWWEEQKYEDGINWMFLEHKGPVFAPLYEPLPENVNFYYDGKPLKLCKAAEEVTSFFAKMLDHEYTTNDVFRKNFFMDWRKEMTLEEKIIIADLGKCDFTEMFTYYKGKMEEKRNPTKEQKLANKEANEKVIQEYGFCIMDHHRERIGNFKIEPPGLFRGRGDHPKQGMLKKRILPEDVIINCSKWPN